MKTCPRCGNACDDLYMFCNNCGYSFENDVKTANTADSADNDFSRSYQSRQQQNSQPYQGQPQQNYQRPYNYQPPCPPQNPRSNPLAIASLVLGICGLVLLCCYLFGVIPSILAIIFGAVSRKAILQSDNNEGGLGYSTAGLILGIISVAIVIIIIVIMVIGSISMADLFTAIPVKIANNRF